MYALKSHYKYPSSQIPGCAPTYAKRHIVKTPSPVLHTVHTQNLLNPAPSSPQCVRTIGTDPYWTESTVLVLEAKQVNELKAKTAGVFKDASKAYNFLGYELQNVEGFVRMSIKESIKERLFSKVGLSWQTQVLLRS